MCDGRADDLAAAVAPGEGAVRRFDPQVNLAADELEAGVPHEDPRKEARLAQDLEAVADAEHRHAFVGRFGDRAHYRRARRDRSRAEVIAVRETAGQHDQVEPGECRFGVPHRGRADAGDLLQRDRHVAVAVGAGEEDDRGFHRQPFGSVGLKPAHQLQKARF